MTVAQRVWLVIRALVTVFCSVLLFEYPANGYFFVVLILEVSLFIYALRNLVYYFSLARYMVGGIEIFYRSIIVLDISLFALGLHEMPQKIVMLYLIACLAFYGVVDVIEAYGARKLAAPWKASFFHGTVKFILALVCLFHMDSVETATIVYGVSLIYSALTDVLSAFRKTAIVYVE